MKRMVARVFLAVFALSLFAVCGVSTPGAAAEGEYKFSKDIVFVVPGAAGSSFGAYVEMFKIVAEKNGHFDHNIIVEYRPGATGMIGMNYMFARPHDGYTVVLAASNPEYLVATNQAETFDQYTYVGVGSFGFEQCVLVTAADSPFNNIDDVIAFARENPGQLNWGSSGTLGTLHFFALQVMRSAGIEVNYVPFGNAVGTNTAAAAGDIQVGGTMHSGSLALVEAGQTKHLAQGGLQRNAAIPDIPSVFESPDLPIENFVGPFGDHRGIIAPAATPPEVLAAWDKLLYDVVHDPEYQAWGASLPGCDLSQFMTGAALTEHMRNSTVKLTELFKEMFPDG